MIDGQFAVVAIILFDLNAVTTDVLLARLQSGDWTALREGHDARGLEISDFHGTARWLCEGEILGIGFDESANIVVDLREYGSVSRCRSHVLREPVLHD